MKQQMNLLNVKGGFLYPVNYRAINELYQWRWIPGMLEVGHGKGLTLDTIASWSAEPKHHESLSLCQSNKGGGEKKKGKNLIPDLFK